MKKITLLVLLLSISSVTFGQKNLWKTTSENSLSKVKKIFRKSTPNDKAHY